MEKQRHFMHWTNILIMIQKDIAGMLEDYEQDYHTGMTIPVVADLIYDYTAGYPYLVSYLCKVVHERKKGECWTEDDNYNAYNQAINIGEMFGFVINEEMTKQENQMICSQEKISFSQRVYWIWIRCYS